MPKFSAPRGWVGNGTPSAIPIVEDTAVACPVLAGWSIRAKDDAAVRIDFRDGEATGPLLATVIVAQGTTSTVTLPIPVQAVSGSVYFKAVGKVAQGVVYSA